MTTGCGAQIRRYPALEGTEHAHKTASKLMDANEFILQQIISNKLELKPLNKKVYLHKPCSQSQITKNTRVIERLLGLIPKIEIITFEDEHICCGAGGINTLTEEKLAQRLIKNKIYELKNNSATFLVSSNIGCALHFLAQLKHEDIDIKVCHPITLLAQQVI
ncbi:MAG: (Fe-S)-binding protein [Gammaproteobacteria bacterium]